MKHCAKGLAIALGMFTTLPVPYFDWDEDSLKWAMPALPLVGGLVGLVWWLGAYLLAGWGPAHLLHSFLLLALPLCCTGLLHLDGLMDTMDALLSQRDRAERLRILKDPHLGAFGAVSMMLVLLGGFAAASALVQQGDIRLLALLPVLSRCHVAQWMTGAPPISDQGLAATFAKSPPRYMTPWLVAVAAVVGLVAILWGGTSLLLPLVVASLVGQLVARGLQRAFGGVSGDLCGCVMVVTELAGLLVATLF